MILYVMNSIVSKTSTNKKIIYIDMDDVLCDFIGAYNKALAEKGKKSLKGS